MRKIILVVITIFAAMQMQAQKVTAVENGFSGGFKLGVNSSTFRLGSNVPDGVDKSWKAGFAGGFWFNIPAGKKFSVQPELLYSQMGGIIKGPVTGYNRYITIEQRINYFSIPVLLKAHLSKVFSIYAGPQFDARLNSKWTRSGFRGDMKNTDSVRSSDWSIVGGVQFFPASKFFLDVRYIHGLQKVWNNTASSYYNQGFQFSVGMRLFGKTVPKVKAPVVPPVVIVPDTDGDGIKDDVDKCPTVAGVEKYQGCPVPDTDGDGINDDNDKCPTVAGTAKYQGCPIPDTDGDGINDEEDKCPTVAGVAKYQGCPIPDTDGDGVNDDDDRCPNVAGPATNFGCPIIGIEAYKVVFKSGSAVLLPEGKKELDKAVAYLKANEGFDIMIEGHTDNTGSDKINNPLSVKRADAVKAYFVKNGLPAERFTTKGFGSTTPVADNKTADGRKHNRRIEVKMKN